MSPLAATTKIVLITGANQGLGFAIAKSLSSKPGYHVLMGSRNTQRGIEAASKLQQQGLAVEALDIDVTSDESIAKATSVVSSKFGRLDVLINNAGVAIDEEGSPGSKGKPPLAGSKLRTVYQDTFAVNTFGAAVTTEAFTSLLSLSSAPRIVFMSSILGSLAYRSAAAIDGAAALPIYRSSKAALNMIVLHYASKYKDAGWKINACCPGYCATNLNSFAGFDSPETGAINAVRLAMLGEDGETGTYSNKEGVIPW
ncbi:hypothetical protein BP5796_05034 [Coleophoma crateriformis]|uniref:Carbonyl reductase n=1 Tax=Coleophoma crateriformis TaxID=565419 RepID=A0A3D8S248_9HELO|nr:hypothetical protein BP5796_05034 [Coleophoma crateriformis]